MSDCSRFARSYRELADRWPQSEWLQQLCHRAETVLEERPHGDLPRWLEALNALPSLPQQANLDESLPRLGPPVDLPESLSLQLQQLHPWRKGPLSLGGVTIDTEWRSDWKWQRIEPHIDLRNKRVLDVGCGNGYFGWRMLGAGAKLVIGIDPTVLFVMQWMACRHFAGPMPNYVLPLGIEEVPALAADLDTIFSMGVLYHRKNPLQHLLQLKSLLQAGGTLVLETLVLPEDQAKEVLIPEGRYARMRNVWAVPGTGQLLAWLEEAGFEDARLVDLTPTTVSEQRSTSWMRFDSLKQALDPQDTGKTIEGLPAPIRAMVVARMGAA